MFLHHEYTKLSNPKQEIEDENFIDKSMTTVEYVDINQ
jgi:hypothetical protein